MAVLGPPLILFLRGASVPELDDRALYRTHQLPEDLLLVEVDNLLGACAAGNGDYAGADAQQRAVAA